MAALKSLSTTAQVMAVLGENPDIAALVDSNAKAVSNWRSSKTFPSNTYCAMTDALAQRGYSAPRSLWGMRAPRRRPESRQPARASA